MAFIEWLGTVDGKNRTPKQATEIAVDVSKFLHFCSQEAVQILFVHTSRIQLLLDNSADSEAHPCWYSSELLRMKSFLTFLLSGSHVTLNKDEKEKLQDMTAKLNSWHSYFSKLKNKDAKERKARIGEIVQNIECIEPWWQLQRKKL